MLDILLGFLLKLILIIFIGIGTLAVVLAFILLWFTLPTCYSHLKGVVKNSYLFIKVSLKGCLPHFCHHLTVDLSIGMTIALIMLYFHYQPFLLNMEDQGMDWVMKVRQKQIPSPGEKKIPAFIALDIDDKTQEKWGEPLFTPRNRLKDLIEVAVKGEARLIIVDIDLSRETPTEGLQLPNGLERHPYDQELLNYLQDYVTTCKSNPKCPLIILARSFYLDSPENLIMKPRIGFLEKNLKQPEPYIQWASALFYGSDDHVIRRWSLWQPTCSKQETGTGSEKGITPSIQLLAASLIRNDSTPQKTQELLSNKLNVFMPQNCKMSEYNLPDGYEVILFDKLTINTDRKGIHQRIMYSMPWLESGKSLPYYIYRSENSGTSGNNSPLLEILPAYPFAPPSSFSVEELKQLLKEKVVVIGGSYLDGSDVHKTPLGNMPGYMVIINAIYSLLQYEQIKTFPTWAKLLVEALLIACMSFMLVCFHSLWGMVFAGVIVIFILLPSSIALFAYGIWLDFALPLLAVLLHQFHHLHKELKALEKCRQLHPDCKTDSHEKKEHGT